MSTATNNARLQPVIAPLAERELPEAERIVRVAFGTFLGAPDPETFWADRDYVYGRSRAPHVAAFGATLDDALVGSNFATKWGSVGFFGPLTVRPELHDRGIAQALLAKTVDQFDAWGTTHSGLFTFAQSAKHVALYQRFGFYPRFLTALMSAPAQRSGPVPGASRFSALTGEGKAEALRASRGVTDSLYPGLDLSEEIAAADAQGLGDTVLVEGPRRAGGLRDLPLWPPERGRRGILLHQVRRRARDAVANKDYGRLLDAAESLAASAGMPNLLAGANLAAGGLSTSAARGFRSAFQGVNMHKHNEPGYCRPGHIIDDWR